MAKQTYWIQDSFGGEHHVEISGLLLKRAVLHWGAGGKNPMKKSPSYKVVGAAPRGPLYSTPLSEREKRKQLRVKHLERTLKKGNLLYYEQRGKLSSLQISKIKKL